MQNSSGTLYITIGPQCCGKTTFLSHLDALDINMDSMPHTYQPVPLDDVLRYFLEELSPQENEIYCQVISGSSLGERIQKLAESECFPLILFFTEVRMSSRQRCSATRRESPQTNCILS
jgi:hypothetical protein